jgi:hypothetical protein
LLTEIFFALCGNFIKESLFEAFRKTSSKWYDWDTVLEVGSNERLILLL